MQNIDPLAFADFSQTISLNELQKHADMHMLQGNPLEPILEPVGEDVENNPMGPMVHQAAPVMGMRHRNGPEEPTLRHVMQRMDGNEY